MVHNRAFLAEQAKIFKALGHPSRLLMVDALRGGELCVCELQKLVGDDMSTVSKHLAVLKEAGVVDASRRGTSTYYRLALCCLDTFLRCTGDVVEQRIRAQLAVLDRLPAGSAQRTGAAPCTTGEQR
ncbi:MAG TPA: helix-turn-helix transcriptional regulator [Candidatus Avidesulfovibrio excrementigallinarum]|nr:helix-turn-helix transcriptional regulator [Candidatus Avidesulfovibrio excrementigallinarum]